MQIMLVDRKYVMHYNFKIKNKKSNFDLTAEQIQETTSNNNK